MRTFIVGDTHADPTFVSNVHKLAREKEVEAIVQLGDFGYGFSQHENVIASIKAWLDRDESHRWYWIDGNHDNHDKLTELVEVHNNGQRDLIPFFHDRLFYVARGAVFQLGNSTALGLGGAYSIDWKMRREGVSWWRGETITAADMYHAGDNAHGYDIDVMFTHDAPMSDVLESMLGGAGYKNDPHSLANRANLTRVVDEVRPQTLYHGHYHQRYRTSYVSPDGWVTQVEGVGANIVMKFSGQYRDPEVRLDDNVLLREF